MINQHGVSVVVTVESFELYSEIIKSTDIVQFCHEL